MLLEDLLDFLKHLFRLNLGADVVVLLQLSVVLYYLLCFVLISNESLLNALNVVVASSAGLSSLQQSVGHDFLTALEVKNEGKIYLVRHDLLPF